MPNKEKAILAPESDCESCGSNSGVLLKWGRNKLVESGAEDIFFYLVKPKRRSMQHPCQSGTACNALMWSLHRHRIQLSPMSLPSCYTDYSFWESVANLANTISGLELDVESTLSLVSEMKENDDVLPYVNAFVDASHSHTSFLLDPKVNPIAEVGSAHALVTSTPSEPGPSTKKRKATIYGVQSLLMKCTNLPRPTIYAAMKKFENKTTRNVWMNDTLDNKLDFLEDATPKKSMKDFLHWRNGPEIRFLC